MGKARGLALIAVVALAGCGGSKAAKPQTLRLALPLVPTVLDPAKASDLPSLNVSHELYAGLTRFSETGVEPDLAESWDVGEGGLVWTFHLRKGIQWSDDTPITAADFKRSWLRALAPGTNAPYAGPELGIVRGARHLHATGNGSIGVQVLDDRTLRVTLQHPVPWFDELAAFPVAAPVPPRPTLYSGPFRIVSRAGGKLVLERNFNYWNAGEVKPSRLVLGTATKGADAVLPRQLAGPGLPWIDTAGPAAPSADELELLATGQLWLVTRGTPLSDLLCSPVRRVGDHAPRPWHEAGLVRAARDARRERRQLARVRGAAERAPAAAAHAQLGRAGPGRARRSRPSCAARPRGCASSSSSSPSGRFRRWPSSRPRTPT